MNADEFTTLMHDSNELLEKIDQVADFVDRVADFADSFTSLSPVQFGGRTIPIIGFVLDTLAFLYGIFATFFIKVKQSAEEAKQEKIKAIGFAVVSILLGALALAFAQISIGLLLGGSIVALIADGNKLYKCIKQKNDCKKEFKKYEELRFKSDSEIIKLQKIAGDKENVNRKSAIAELQKLRLAQAVLSKNKLSLIHSLKIIKFERKHLWLKIAYGSLVVVGFGIMLGAPYIGSIVIAAAASIALVHFVGKLIIDRLNKKRMKMIEDLAEDVSENHPVNTATLVHELHGDISARKSVGKSRFLRMSKARIPKDINQESETNSLLSRKSDESGKRESSRSGLK